MNERNIKREAALNNFTLFLFVSSALIPATIKEVVQRGACNIDISCVLALFNESSLFFMRLIRATKELGTNEKALGGFGPLK